MPKLPFPACGKSGASTHDRVEQKHGTDQAKVDLIEPVIGKEEATKFGSLTHPAVLGSRPSISMPSPQKWEAISLDVTRMWVVFLSI